MSPVLAIERLSAVTGDTALLRDVSLDVAAGEVHGLVGMSGAGKSMIAKAVLGVLPQAVRITSGSSSSAKPTLARAVKCVRPK